MGGAFVAILPKLSPSVRSRVLRVLLGRSDWVSAFVESLEHDPARLSELALDQKQKANEEFARTKNLHAKTEESLIEKVSGSAASTPKQTE